MVTNSDRENLTSVLDRLIKKGTSKQYHVFFQKYHEADIADALQELGRKKQHLFFTKVKPEIAAEVLEELDIDQQLALILDLKTERGAKFIEEMEPDDAVDLLEELLEANEQKAEDIIDALPKKEAEDIQELLSQAEDSAGAMMTSEYLAIPENLNVKEAIAAIKKQNPPDSEISFYIFIVDSENHLIGYTTLRNLLLSKSTEKITNIRNGSPISATIDTDQEDIAKIFEKYDLIALPIVSNENKLVGLITVDDVVDIVIEEANEDIYRLSGTSDVDDTKLITGNFMHAVNSRLPWLLITIFGGFLAAYIINTYSKNYNDALYPLAISLSFIPMLMGLAGNVGNQSATIMVRGLATGLVDDKKALKYIGKETIVGLIIGSIIAFFVYIFTAFFIKIPILSAVVAISLLVNITVGTLLGASLPMILKRCKIDPAIASAPFISTALDIIGQIIYFLFTIGIMLCLPL